MIAVVVIKSTYPIRFIGEWWIVEFLVQEIIYLAGRMRRVGTANHLDYSHYLTDRYLNLSI